MAALADQSQCRPERGLRAGDDRNVQLLLERLRYAQRAQAAAGDQQRLRSGRVGADLGTELDDIGLALAAGLAKPEQAEAGKRQHLEALRPEKGSEPVVDVV